MRRVSPFLSLCFVALASLLAASCGSDPPCQEQVFTAKCSTSGCHDKDATSAGFSMATPGWEHALVGGKQKGGGITGFVSVPECANMNYLEPGSNPATGLFLRKMTSQFGCGKMMPYIGTPVTASELTCIQTWANGLTTGS
jgi:hypothetical protein